MGRYKVLNSFRDKHTGELHKKGTSYECDKTRFDEVQKKGNFLAEEKVSQKADKEKK